eukprot:2409488-Alexandrium_andersonii.AAC.1
MLLLASTGAAGWHGRASPAHFRALPIDPGAAQAVPLLHSVLALARGGSPRDVAARSRQQLPHAVP